MPSSSVLTTGQVATRLGIDRRTVLLRVQRGALVPTMKLDGPRGAYLFDAEQIDRTAGTSQSEVISR